MRNEERLSVVMQKIGEVAKILNEDGDKSESAKTLDWLGEFSQTWAHNLRREVGHPETTLP